MSTNKPLVSIIIPCFNSAKFVSRSIDSALSQSYPYTEIILVDNNSTDETLSILKDYQSQYPDKITVLTELKKGAPAARNQGLNAAKGEWIQFLDSDDLLLPRKIEHQVSLVEYSNADIIIGNYIKKTKFRKRKIKAISNEWIGLIQSRLGITSANLFRTTSLIVIYGWDESKTSSQEYDLMLRLLKKGYITVFDDNYNTITYQRFESVSQSFDFSRQFLLIKNSADLRQEIKKYLIVSGLMTKAREESINKYLYKKLRWSKYSSPIFFRKYKNDYSFRLPLLFKLKVIIKEEIRRIYIRIVHKKFFKK